MGPPAKKTALIANRAFCLPLPTWLTRFTVLSGQKRSPLCPWLLIEYFISSKSFALTSLPHLPLCQVSSLFRPCSWGELPHFVSSLSRQFSVYPLLLHELYFFSPRETPPSRIVHLHAPKLIKIQFSLFENPAPFHLKRLWSLYTTDQSKQTANYCIFEISYRKLLFYSSSEARQFFLNTMCLYCEQHWSQLFKLLVVYLKFNTRNLCISILSELFLFDFRVSSI